MGNFFFQAEDGIRDLTVTGVQTCALPISLKRDFKGAIAESNELFYKLCDVIVSPTGERRYVASAEKAYDVLIAPRLAREKRRDRKSTRLNSSHSQISYAVFCLKKKKKTY